MSRYARENCDFEPSNFIDYDYYPEDYYEQDDSQNYEFYTKVVGVTYEGRQRYIRNMQVGEYITLEREPDNPYDKNAIKVINEQGFQIGFLSKDLSAKLAVKMDNGIRLSAICSAITGNNPGDSLGVNIKIRYESNNFNTNDNMHGGERDMCNENQDCNKNGIVVCIKDFFDKYELIYNYDSKNNAFIIQLDLDGALKSVKHVIHVLDNKCLCNSSINFNADESVRMAVAEYITRINFNIIEGSFKLDFNDGEILFSHCMNFEENTISEAAINYLVLYPHRVLEAYGKGLLSVVFGMQSPKDAYNELNDN